MKNINNIIDNLLNEGYKTGDNAFETGKVIGRALSKGKLRKGKTKEQADKQVERIGGKVSDRGKKGASNLLGKFQAAAREAAFSKGLKTMESKDDIKTYIRNLLEGLRSGGDSALTGKVVGKALRSGNFRKGKTRKAAEEQGRRIGYKIGDRAWRKSVKAGDKPVDDGEFTKGMYFGSKYASQYPESYTPTEPEIKEGVTSGGDPILTGMRIGKAKANPKKSFNQRADQESRIGDKIADRVAKKTGQDEAGERAWGKYTGAKFATKYGGLNPRDLKKMSEAIVKLYSPFFQLLEHD